MLRDLLNLKNEVQVSRQVETPDGMGGTTIVETLTTLKYAALWSPSQSARYISDKMARVASHILVTESPEYTFTTDDKNIIYNGNTYVIAGPSDDVMNLGEIMVTPLDRIQ